ncbi:MAG TPA: XRE family transcriptional regulator [Nitrospirae bacterium]|nr:DNA-binding transcriptional repressor PuuR [bacterium BMS3Bbin08]HDH50881.1 XRE family transcriptional regulator [Nitrospirota bacterium]HDK17451.1 XRE family transcriptional regulator [Nitrospirota bacterium]HDO25259.1 XRE family transcriptional regulator [Nitrospirota bacterium]HDZ84474.1 XRE family transcriptional regulator [Nitrospirota bacterium]
MKRKNIVGKNLRNIRKKLGLTQEEVALRSGLSQGYINQLENGKRMFTQKSIEHITEALDIPVIEFFREGTGGAELICEETADYKREKRTYSKKEILALLNDLPSGLRDHYIDLLKLEKKFWKK